MKIRLIAPIKHLFTGKDVDRWELFFAVVAWIAIAIILAYVAETYA